MDFIILIIFLAIALFTGTMVEKRHFKSIRAREDALLDKVYVTDHFSARDQEIDRMVFVDGNCVIGGDYFKMFLGGMINIFGGRVKTFENLLDRSRREAVLRMREKAPDADMIVCTRIQFSELASAQIESMAYGTAVYLKK